MGFPQGSVGDFAATPECRISDFTIASGTIYYNYNRS